MRFSVCIATRNRRAWLPDAIQSVLDQSYPDWQLVILDNGDDRVDDIVPDDPRIRYIQSAADLGMADAFNAAFAHATGDLVVALADDDRLPSTALATYDTAIGGAEWVVAGCSIVDTAGHELHYRGGTQANVEATRSGDYMLGGAICCRRSFLDRVGGFRHEYDGAIDADLYCRMLDAADPAVVPDVCHIYIDHPDTMSRREAHKQQAATARVAAGRR